MAGTCPMFRSVIFCPCSKAQVSRCTTDDWVIPCISLVCSAEGLPSGQASFDFDFDLIMVTTRGDSRFYICKISCHRFFLQIVHGVRTTHRITRRRWISNWPICAVRMHRGPAPKQATAITMALQTFIKIYRILLVFDGHKRA